MMTSEEASLRKQIEELREAIGMSRMDYARFIDGCPIDFEKRSYGSQLGKYIARVKRESSGHYMSR
jgi:hypothetical protein